MKNLQLYTFLKLESSLFEYSDFYPSFFPHFPYPKPWLQICSRFLRPCHSYVMQNGYLARRYTDVPAVIFKQWTLCKHKHLSPPSGAWPCSVSASPALWRSATSSAPLSSPNAWGMTPQTAFYPRRTLYPPHRSSILWRPAPPSPALDQRHYCPPSSSVTTCG